MVLIIQGLLYTHTHIHIYVRMCVCLFMFWFCFQARLFTERIKNIKADATKMSSIDKFTGRAYFHVVSHAGCFCVRGADFLSESSSGVGKGKRERKGVVPAALVACLYKSTPKSRQWHLKTFIGNCRKVCNVICLNFSTKCAKLVAELKYLEFIAKIGIKAYFRAFYYIALCILFNADLFFSYL